MMRKEKGTGVENFVAMIKDIGYNEDLVALRGEVTKELPLEIYLSQHDLTVSGDGVVVNPELLEHEEDAQITLDGQLRQATLFRPNQLTVGTDVMVLFDVKQGTSYVHCRLVSLVD